MITHDQCQAWESEVNHLREKLLECQSDGAGVLVDNQCMRAEIESLEEIVLFFNKSHDLLIDVFIEFEASRELLAKIKAHQESCEKLELFNYRVEEIKNRGVPHVTE